MKRARPYPQEILSSFRVLLGGTAVQKSLLVTSGLLSALTFTLACETTDQEQDEAYRESQGDLQRGLPDLIEAEDFVRASESDDVQMGDEECVSEVNEFVDIGAGEASGGCSVGYAEPGEWLEYDLQAKTAGTFDLVLSLATELPDRSVSISIDGEVRGRIEVPVTSWVEFGESTLESLSLTEGKHVLRLTFETGGVNVDYLKFKSAGECVPSCGDKTCGDDYCGGSCGECESDQMCSAQSQCVGPFKKPVAEHGKLSVSDGQLVDESGQPTALKGVSTQWLNFDSYYPGNLEGMRHLRDSWGMEIYRIANGVEGNKGYAEENGRGARLAWIKQMIEYAIELDIYVLVDWHTHEAEHLDLAVEFFSEIASEYGDNPHVLYEPFNEPIGPAESETDPSAVSDYWKDVVRPYHETVVAAIRAVDPDNVIILGTPRWAQAVDVAAALPVAGDNLAYTLHFYSCSHTGWLRDRAQTALDAGVALFVTEWATTHADGGTSAHPGVCLGEAEIWHDFLSEHHIGSAAWKLNADGDASALLLDGALSSGGWPDSQISEHGHFVRGILQTP